MTEEVLMNLNFPIEWVIITMMTTFMCVYFSYKAGWKSGHSEGIEATLISLENQGVIELEPEEDDL